MNRYIATSVLQYSKHSRVKCDFIDEQKISKITKTALAKYVASCRAVKLATIIYNYSISRNGDTSIYHDIQYINDLNVY